MTEYFYSIIYDGDDFGHEHGTIEAAQAWADDWWAERCEEEGGRNGEVVADEVEIVRCHYTYDDLVEDERIPYRVEHEFYHGDRKEHGTRGL